MASYYGVNHTKAFVNVPSEKIDVSAWKGRMRWVYDEISLAGAVALNEKIYLGIIPKQAKVVEAILAFSDLGAAGVMDLGYEKVDSSLSSDQDAFLAAVDVNSAAGTKKMSDQANMVGFGLELDGDAYIVAKATTATTAAGTLKCAVCYVLD